MALVPIALIVLAGFALRDKEFEEAVQEATAGLVTLIPEGLVLLMSVTLALAAVRLARQNTLVQQMAATEALAAVDTICVDKTGTLTDGSLRLIRVESVDPAGPDSAERALGHVRRLGRRAQPDARDDRRELPGARRAGQRRGTVLLAVEVERADAERLELRDRRPRRAQQGRARSSCRRASSGCSPSTRPPAGG